jgi:O-antigen ligase
VSPTASDSGQRADQWVAVLAGCVPVAIVLGVVVFEFFISVTGLVWLVTRFKSVAWRGREGLFQHPLVFPLAGWLAVVMFSRLANGGTAFQFAHDFAFLRFPLFVVAISDISRRMPVHRYLIGGLIAGIAFGALNLACAHLVGHDFIGKPLSRYVGKLKEGARIGGMCAYAAPFLVLWSLFDQNLSQKQRLWLIIFGFAGLGLLVSSRIRTALMASIIGLAGGALIQLAIRKRIKPAVVLGLLLLAGLGAWGVIRMQPGFGSIYDRVYFWKVSWQIWLHHPVFGVGISSFNEAHRLIAESNIVAPFIAPNGIVYHYVDARHAHNLFLQLLACNGILGFGVFGWLFWRTIQILRDSRTVWRAGLWAWPLVCLAIGLTGWNIYDPFYTSVVFYFLALISISSPVVPTKSSA